MADILPYLGVAHNYTQEDIPGRTVILEDMTGMELEQARKLLKEASLTAHIEGEGETVVAQIPGAGQAVPGGSQVILYLEEAPEQRMTQMPDFAGMNRQQASDTAGAAGIYILISGNTGTDAKVTVTAQDTPPGTPVEVGSTVRLEFTDTTAAD